MPDRREKMSFKFAKDCLKIDNMKQQFSRCVDMKIYIIIIIITPNFTWPSIASLFVILG